MDRPGAGRCPRWWLGPSELAQRWASALAWTSYVPLNRAERHATLVGFAERLGAALVAEPFVEQPGYDVGTDLVVADFASPEALGATIQIMNQHLLAAMYPDPVTGPDPELVDAQSDGSGWPGSSARWPPGTAGRCATAPSMSRRPSGPPRWSPGNRPSRPCATARRGSGTPPCTTRSPACPTAPCSSTGCTSCSHAQPGDRVGVCYIDLDGFKVVNDSLGHDVGDELLVAVAHRLHECVSRAGHLVARMGGDEFVILVAATAPHRGVALAEAVLAALAAPVAAGGHRLSVAASIGIVDRRCTTPRRPT